MKRYGLLALIMMAVVLLPVTALHSQQKQDPDMVYKPEETTVAILPVINDTGERDKKWLDKQTSKGQDALTKQFASRGFKLVDDATIMKALADGKIDLTDEEQRKRSTYFDIGKTVHADLIAVCLIVNTTHQEKETFFRTYWEGKATVKIWLLDVNKSTAILNGKPFEGESSSGAYMGNSGNARIVQAVANAIDQVYREFMAPYKIIKQKRSNIDKGS